MKSIHTVCSELCAIPTVRPLLVSSRYREDDATPFRLDQLELKNWPAHLVLRKPVGKAR